MAVLTGEAYPESEDAVTSPPGEAAYAKPGRCRPKPWGDARRALDAKIASSFAEAREYVKTYEDLRGIYNFGLEWEYEAYEQTPKTVAAFREDMKVQKGWVQDLDRMKTGSNEGVLHVDGKALRGSLMISERGVLRAILTGRFGGLYLEIGVCFLAKRNPTRDKRSHEEPQTKNHGRSFLCLSKKRGSSG